ncbi:hypothetical protein BTA51_04255 [Hahella sp. CCB-MM4]|uniref:ergothioneine biosynthesis protein EgtB n=1 Tax=Hahella sp. (strain CCB-MM4) TaxID=1926491 RepID=UPI000B9A56EA|nr:ergothioneine biosynthesis protein EgtB [Hahella sp. CCB-MM4]OZG74236.1 hypothetical protein BTA51_04255 [Hahella sp. CCB-MM4]
MVTAQEHLLSLYQQVRSTTIGLTDGLTAEDMLLQSMEDASPAKWHLGHTTWFFEALVLDAYQPGYQRFNDQFHYLFNSYYESLGQRHPRPHRGMLSRPSLEQVMKFRLHVDEAMLSLLQSKELPNECWQRLELGLHHEMQHQELLITDQLHAFSFHHFHPIWKTLLHQPPVTSEAAPHSWVAQAGGLVPVGLSAERRIGDFAYDCETPIHQQYLRPYCLASRPVTNGEWLEFMTDGGYRDPQWWLSDGWACVNREGWQAPLYWQNKDDEWFRYTPHGLLPLDPDESVCHVSYFEADAYARWAGARLPTEFEWEVAARNYPIEGRCMEQGLWFPGKPLPGSDTALQHLYGNVWEWTQSPYLAFPGFEPLQGALGEYNGKFMCGQFVLKGGAFTSPEQLLRASYRNFFYPHQRWQATGVRLARYE